MSRPAQLSSQMYVRPVQLLGGITIAGPSPMRHFFDRIELVWPKF
jgi:hypothetical protein